MVLLERGYKFADGDISKLTTLQIAYETLTLKTKIEILTGKGETIAAGDAKGQKPVQTIPNRSTDGVARMVETKKMSSREYIEMRKRERGL
jgi:hypothetical protein